MDKDNNLYNLEDDQSQIFPIENDSLKESSKDSQTDSQKIKETNTTLKDIRNTKPLQNVY